MIKDSINLYNSNQYLNLICFYCGNKEHQIVQCPKLHFTVDHQKVIQDYLVEESQFRKNYCRKDRSSFHAIEELEELQEAASQIQMAQQTEVYYDNTMQDEDTAQVFGSYTS